MAGDSLLVLRCPSASSVDTNTGRSLFQLRPAVQEGGRDVSMDTHVTGHQSWRLLRVQVGKHHCPRLCRPPSAICGRLRKLRILITPAEDAETLTARKETDAEHRDEPGQTSRSAQLQPPPEEAALPFPPLIYSIWDPTVEHSVLG